MSHSRTTFVLILITLAIILALFSYKKQAAPTVPTVSPTQATLPSDASRSQNYSIIPLRQELTTSPATTTTPTSTPVNASSTTSTHAR